MKLTKHAQARQRQRGIPNFCLDIIQQHGRCERAPGGATKVSFGKREYQRTIEQLKGLIQMLDKAKGGTIIIADDGDVLTVYKKS